MSEGKKKKYLQKCKSDYLAEFPCLKKSQRGENYVFCGLCYCDFSIAHSAKRDITQHFSTDKHLKMVAASKKTNKISNLFANNNKEECVIRAECLFTCFIVEHNLPLNCADHVGSLLRKMFPENEIAKKYGCARTKTCDYMVHKFPFKDEVLMHAEVCNFKNIEKFSFSSVRYFLDKFPVLLKSKNVEEEIDTLQSEFATLQVTEVSENIRMEERIDSLWVSIGQLENELYLKQFENISGVMLGILSIPHSNAECERIFSKVKKIRTEFRSSLSDEKLESLLLMKSNFSGNCYDQKFDKEFLNKAKSATYVRNM